MSITVNEGGTLYELDTVTSNEGGTLYELDTVHSNEGGTLYEIYSGTKIPKSLTWKYDSQYTTKTPTVSNNGMRVDNRDNESNILSSHFALKGKIKISTTLWLESGQYNVRCGIRIGSSTSEPYRLFYLNYHTGGAITQSVTLDVDIDDCCLHCFVSGGNNYVQNHYWKFKFEKV